MIAIKPYWLCATRLENRCARPPTTCFVRSLVEGLKLGGVEAVWHSAAEPYGKLLPAFAAEVVRDVGFDGVWFDAPEFCNHATEPSSLPGRRCDWCRERFRNETGHGLPERVDYDDRTFKEWVLWRYDVLMALWEACIDAVSAVHPGAVVCFNNYRRRRTNPSG